MPWPITEAEALAEQDRICQLVQTTGDPGDVRLVAGLDVAYEKDSTRLVGAAVVLDVESLQSVEQRVIRGRVTFPYIPGLLAFREVPVLIEAIERLDVVPDLLICDGHGIAHPRRCGLASHLGVLSGLPSIGVAKNPFIGEYAEPGQERGARTDLIEDGATIGCVLRTRDHVRPVYVSVGHAIDLRDACCLIMRLTDRYRLPEPVRAADHLARVALREWTGDVSTTS
jgi:deoxyribonuclease V